MMKQIAYFSVCVLLLGLVILGRAGYFAIVYGDGNFEAGNFHRCHYWSETNLATGAVERHWDRDWSLTDSTESPMPMKAFAEIDMWIIGSCFVICGLLICMVGFWIQANRRF